MIHTLVPGGDRVPLEKHTILGIVLDTGILLRLVIHAARWTIVGDGPRLGWLDKRHGFLSPTATLCFVRVRSRREDVETCE